MENLGPFEVIETLGEEPKRTVHKARRADGERPIRLVVCKEAIPDERLEAAARIATPGIARLLSWGEHSEGGVWYETELPEGLTFESVIARAPLPVPAALVAFDVLLERLADAHATGLVHGAIDARRLVFTREGPVLLDYGLGDPRSDEPHVLLARPPEVWRGGDPEARSDLYSLGVLLYLGCSGRYPFEKDPCRGHLAEPAPRLEVKGPPELETVVGRLLAKFPRRRYESAAEARRAIAELRARSGPAPGKTAEPSQATRALAVARAALEQASRASRDPDTIRVLYDASSRLRAVEQSFDEIEKARDEAAREHEAERVGRAIAADRAQRTNDELGDALAALDAALARAAQAEDALDDAWRSRDAERARAHQQTGRARAAEEALAQERDRAKDEVRLVRESAERSIDEAKRALESERTRVREEGKTTTRFAESATLLEAERERVRTESARATAAIEDALDEAKKKLDFERARTKEEQERAHGLEKELAQAKEIAQTEHGKAKDETARANELQKALEESMFACEAFRETARVRSEHVAALERALEEKTVEAPAAPAAALPLEEKVREAAQEKAHDVIRDVDARAAVREAEERATRAEKSLETARFRAEELEGALRKTEERADTSAKERDEALEKAKAAEQAHEDALGMATAAHSELKKLETKSLANEKALADLRKTARVKPTSAEPGPLEVDAAHAAQREAEARANRAETDLALAKKAATEACEIQRVLQERADAADEAKQAAVTALSAARDKQKELETKLARSMKALAEAVALAEAGRAARKAQGARATPPK